MQRRKFAIGMGALATGSGAVLSSGAFSQVESQRDVDIDSVGDNRALLEFAPVNGDLLGQNYVAGTIDSRSEFVNLVNDDQGNKAATIDFSAMEESGLPGDGLNNQSVTVIEDLFHILNAGMTDIELSIHDAGEDLRDDIDISSEDSLVDLSTQPEGIAFFVSKASNGSDEPADFNDLGVNDVSMSAPPAETNWSNANDSLAEYIGKVKPYGYHDIGAVTLGAAIDVGGVVDDDKINGKIRQGGEKVEDVTIVAQTTDTDSAFES